MLSKKELFVLTITLKQFGLTPSEIKSIIEHFNYKGTKYNLIMKSINKLQKHYEDATFDQHEFCRLIKIDELHNRRVEVLINCEQVFRDNGYSDAEIIHIENLFSHIMGHRAESLDIKLRFYNDIDVKYLIVQQPHHLKQGIKLSYARNQFLMIKPTYEQEKPNMFLPEFNFKGEYGVDNRTLLEKYPMEDIRYLVKK